MDEWDRYVETAKADKARRKELRFNAEAGHVWGLMLMATIPFALAAIVAIPLWIIFR